MSSPPPPMPELLGHMVRSALTPHGIEVLSLTVRCRLPSGMTVTMICDPPGEVVSPLPAVADSSSGRQQGQQEPDLNPTETAILAALIEAQRPLKAVVLARKSSCNCNSHFRGVLSSLRERGLVRHVEEGYLPTTC